MSVLCKIPCIHSDEVVSDHSDHGESTQIVRQVVQRLVGHHFGRERVDVRIWSKDIWFRCRGRQLSAIRTLVQVRASFIVDVVLSK
jgi:hypothetical protein